VIRNANAQATNNSGQLCSLIVLRDAIAIVILETHGRLMSEKVVGLPVPAGVAVIRAAQRMPARHPSQHHQLDAGHSQDRFPFWLGRLMSDTERVSYIINHQHFCFLKTGKI
jgi:hypothetical protein